MYNVVCKWFPNQVRRITARRADDRKGAKKEKEKRFMLEHWRRANCLIYLLILIQMQMSQDLIVLESN